ncbi:hypothetical protein JCM19047_1250 [Bacillus sp. JCM 19047]|nr:hypothetical protein JCM19047_1250 [Bacillus sp. JCM 19047]
MVLYPSVYAPINDKTNTIGYSTLAGVRNTLINMPTIKILIMTKIKFPINILLMSVHTRSGLFSNNKGPGVIPIMTNAPSITAVVPDPGIPIVNIGMSDPTAAELLADSGATSPSTAPLPNSSFRFDSCFSVEYASKEEIVPPDPGKTPRKKPSGPLRKIGPSDRFHCSFVNHLLPMAWSFFGCCPFFFGNILYKTSPSA